MITFILNIGIVDHVSLFHRALQAILLRSRGIMPAFGKFRYKAVMDFIDPLSTIALWPYHLMNPNALTVKIKPRKAICDARSRAVVEIQI